MRTYDAATLAYLNARKGVCARHLLRVEAKNRSTGLTEVMGIWNGDQNQFFTIEGDGRTYVGAGTLLAVDEITATVGLDVRIHNFTLSGISSDIEQLIRGYDARLAGVKVYRALYDLDDNTLVAEPVRILKGWINEISFVTGAEDGASEVTLSVANSSRALTRTLAAVRSKAAQREIFATDRFRDYTDISRPANVDWG